MQYLLKCNVTNKMGRNLFHVTQKNKKERAPLSVRSLGRCLTLLDLLLDSQLATVETALRAYTVIKYRCATV